MLCVLALDRLIPRSHPKPVLTIPIPATKRALLTYGLVAAVSVSAAALAVSFTAIMLLSAAHVSVLLGSEQRIYATLLGGGVSILVMWLASKTVARDFAI